MWDFSLTDNSDSRVSDGMCTQNTLSHAFSHAHSLSGIHPSYMAQAQDEAVCIFQNSSYLAQHVVHYTWDDQHIFTLHPHSFLSIGTTDLDFCDGPVWRDESLPRSTTSEYRRWCPTDWNLEIHNPLRPRSHPATDALRHRCFARLHAPKCVQTRWSSESPRCPPWLNELQDAFEDTLLLDAVLSVGRISSRTSAITTSLLLCSRMATGRISKVVIAPFGCQHRHEQLNQHKDIENPMDTNEMAATELSWISTLKPKQRPSPRHVEHWCVVFTFVSTATIIPTHPHKMNVRHLSMKELVVLLARCPMHTTTGLNAKKTFQTCTRDPILTRTLWMTFRCVLWRSQWRRLTRSQCRILHTQSSNCASTDITTTPWPLGTWAQRRLWGYVSRSSPRHPILRALVGTRVTNPTAIARETSWVLDTSVLSKQCATTNSRVVQLMSYSSKAINERPTITRLMNTESVLPRHKCHHALWTSSSRPWFSRTPEQFQWRKQTREDVSLDDEEEVVDCNVITEHNLNFSRLRHVQSRTTDWTYDLLLVAPHIPCFSATHTRATGHPQNKSREWGSVTINHALCKWEKSHA